MTNKRIQRWTKALILMLGIMQLSGCGLSTKVPENVDTKLPDENIIVVGFAQVGSESVWRTANTDSILTALEDEAGYFVVYENSRQKQENQIKAVREFISQRVDYIVFSPVQEDGWETVLQEAQEAGIPVILVDRKVNVEDRDLYQTWIGSDMKEEGRKAGQWLESYEAQQGLSQSQINIVVLKGTEGATATIGRTDGFHEIADTHANWNILEEVSGDFTTAKGGEVMQELIAKYPDIDVVISQNDDMTFGALKAMQDANISTGTQGQVAVVSFDACSEALKLVQSGIINVDIECNPLQGEYVKNVIQQCEMGLTVHKNYWVDEGVYTLENVADALKDRKY